VRTVDDFAQAFEDAIAASALTTLVAKVEATGPPVFLTDLPMLENRFQFQRHLRTIDAK
jgi:hypothetical protein